MTTGVSITKNDKVTVSTNTFEWQKPIDCREFAFTLDLPLCAHVFAATVRCVFLRSIEIHWRSWLIDKTETRAFILIGSEGELPGDAQYIPTRVIDTSAIYHVFEDVVETRRLRYIAMHGEKP